MMTLEQYARDYLNPAMRELDPAGYREMEVEEAARAGVARWRQSNFIPPEMVLKWIDDGSHDPDTSALINLVRDAWREQHA